MQSGSQPATHPASSFFLPFTIAAPAPLPEIQMSSPVSPSGPNAPVQAAGPAAAQAQAPAGYVVYVRTRRPANFMQLSEQQQNAKDHSINVCDRLLPLLASLDRPYRLVEIDSVPLDQRSAWLNCVPLLLDLGRMGAGHADVYRGSQIWEYIAGLQQVVPAYDDGRSTGQQQGVRQGARQGRPEGALPAAGGNMDEPLNPIMTDQQAASQPGEGDSGALGFIAAQDLGSTREGKVSPMEVEAYRQQLSAAAPAGEDEEGEAAAPRSVITLDATTGKPVGAPTN